MSVTERDVIQEALQRQLDADVAIDVWDEPPNLALIVREGDGPPRFAPMPIDEETWGVAEPHRVMRAAAAAARTVHERTGWTPFEPGQELLGVAFFTEGYGLTQNDKESAAIIQAWMRDGHRLSEHPLSIEVKLVTAVLADDLPIMLMHGRGGTPLPSSDMGEVEGRVPEALTFVLTVFLELVPSG